MRKRGGLGFVDDDENPIIVETFSEMPIFNSRE